jgi:hypothetical protein
VSKPAPYLILRDSREKPGQGWEFDPSDTCLGTEVRALKTGDYSLEGYESVLAVERKRSTGEIATNLFEDRFWRELDRLEAFPLPFLVCEFTMDDLLSFPKNSGIPPGRWRFLKVRAPLLLKRFVEMTSRHKTKVILAGKHGKAVASSIFKRVVEGAA